jgi:hypothetical protein
MAALQAALLGPMPAVTAASMPAALSATSGPALPLAPCLKRGQQHWDVLVVGDEPAGVMTALELADQLPRLTGRPNPRIALVTEADTRLGLGGVIVRSGLAYLDRNQVPRDMWDVLTPFAPSSRLYERFLRITGVNHIAVDRRRASTALAKSLRQARIPVLNRADLVGVVRQACRFKEGLVQGSWPTRAWPWAGFLRCRASACKSCGPWRKSSANGSSIPRTKKPRLG